VGLILQDLHEKGQLPQHYNRIKFVYFLKNATMLIQDFTETNMTRMVGQSCNAINKRNKMIPWGPSLSKFDMDAMPFPSA